MMYGTGPPTPPRARVSVRRPPSRTNERGASAIELALVFPIFLTIIIGAVDFGQAILLYNVSANAAREGARAAQVAVVPNPTPSAVPTITAAQATAVTAAARDLAGPLGPQLAVTPSAGVDANGQYVRVVVTTTYQPAAASLLGVNNIKIAAASQLYLP